jgi:AraC-like DNA-binding protein
MDSMQFSRPSQAARRFVRFYAHRNHCLPAFTLVHPVTARAAHVLDFEFGDTIGIGSSDSVKVEIAPDCAVIGVVTSQVHQLLIRGKIESFAVFLRPAALGLLFKLPVAELTDRHYEASGVMGNAVLGLRERLGNAANFHERAQVADQFFQSFQVAAFDTIEQAANEILHRHGVCRISKLAHQAGWGVRQFERLFQQRIGASPKLYARIVRYESALETKAFSPGTSWTTVAHRFGYHDQMHMIHDFQQLSGETPSGILAQVESIFPPKTAAANGEGYNRVIL